MVFDLQAANYAPAVQPLVMMAQLVYVVALLVREITLNQKLAGEVVIARERPIIVFRSRVPGHTVCKAAQSTPKRLPMPTGSALRLRDNGPQRCRDRSSIAPR